MTDTTSPRTSTQVIALIVASALFMQNLDGAIINTSLPQMAASFHVSSVTLNIGSTAYILAVAAFVPLSGWVSDRFGARRVFAAAIALFALASVACAIAANLPQFVAARVVQGIGGALMTPVGRIIVLKSARKDQLLQALSLIVWPALIAPVVAPVLGGAITTYMTWRWNFLLNAPLGVIGVLLVLRLAPRDTPEPKRRLDFVGSALTALGLTLLIYGLDRLAAGVNLWLTLSILIASLVTGGLCVVWFRRTPHPLLDLDPLRIPTFAVAALDAGNFMRLAMSAVPFLLPLMLQLIWRLSPLQAGGFMLVYFVGNIAMKSITTPILRRFGFRKTLIVNGLAVAASVAALALLTQGTPLWATYAVLVLAGAARSLQFTAINSLTFADIPKGQTAAASTFASMTQQVATALGVAIAAVLLHFAQVGRGGERLIASDFQLAFLAIAVLAGLGVLLALRLTIHAGGEVSGHRPAGKTEA